MPSFPTFNKQFLLISLALVALAAGALALYATAQGPVGFSDSAAYLSAGRNWARGDGLGLFQASGDFEPLSVHPPLYPALFSLLHLLGIDLVAGGRGLAVAAPALAPLALGLIFVRHSRSPWLGLPVAAIYALFPPILYINAALLTDGLFLAVLLWGLLALLEYRQTHSRAWAATAILLFGALPLIRFIGAAFIGAAALILLLWERGDLRSRLQRAFLFTALMALPYALWQLWSFFNLDATLAGRQANLSPNDIWPALGELVGKADGILAAWLPLSTAIVVGMMLLLLGLALRKRAPEQPDQVLLGSFALLGLAFLGGVTAAYLFTRPTPDIIERTLLPLFVCLLGLLAAAAAWWAERAPRTANWLALLAGAAILLALVRPARVQLAPLHRGQVGYFTDAWRHSKLLADLRDLPAGTAIIASDPSITLYWVDRPAFDFFHALRDEFIPDGEIYGSDAVDDAQVAFSQGDAVLVLFEDYPHGLAERLAANGTLANARLLADYPQGQLYIPIQEATP